MSLISSLEVGREELDLNLKKSWIVDCPIIVRVGGVVSPTFNCIVDDVLDVFPEVSFTFIVTKYPLLLLIAGYGLSGSYVPPSPTVFSISTTQTRSFDGVKLLVSEAVSWDIRKFFILCSLEIS